RRFTDVARRRSTIQTADSMKAIVYHRYGSPDVLQYEDIEKPTVGDDQVLIKVRAASVNPHDWHYMRGKPYIMRISGGLRMPKATRLGVDVAGQVEAVGKNVTQFKPGNEVFGGYVRAWAFAEYACTPASALDEAGQRDVRASGCCACRSIHRVAGSSRQGTGA